MIRFTILLSFILISGFINAQDSISKSRIRIFDSYLFMAFDFIENEKKVNLDYIQSFTRNPRHSFSNSSYPDTVKFSLYEIPGGETDGGEFGFVSTFKMPDSKSPFIRKFKPRLGVFYNYKQFFTYDVNLRNSTIDTVNQGSGGSGILIHDSVGIRDISYSYYSEQMCLEAGTNFDLFVRKKTIVYTGFIYSQGISFKNEFTTERTDSYRVDKYGDNGLQTGEQRIVSKSKYSSVEPTSYSFRVSVPVGLQYRFSTAENFSLGFTLEGKFGFYRYMIERGRSVTSGLFAVVAGLRFSFLKHK